jgi:hypothetical protein
MSRSDQSTNCLYDISFLRTYFWSLRFEGAWSSWFLGVAGPSAVMIRTIWLCSGLSVMRKTVARAWLRACVCLPALEVVLTTLLLDKY